MVDARAVQELHAVEDGAHDFHSLVVGQTAALLHIVLQRLSVDILHDIVGGAVGFEHLVHLHYIAVLGAQRGKLAGFGDKVVFAALVLGFLAVLSHHIAALAVGEGGGEVLL